MPVQNAFSLEADIITCNTKSTFSCVIRKDVKTYNNHIKYLYKKFVFLKNVDLNCKN